MPKKIKAPTPGQRIAARSMLTAARAAGATVTPIQSVLTLALNRVRTETHQDRIYEIYPATLLKEMVLHGTGGAFEKGPALVPGSEIESTAFLWSDTPILVNHPDWGIGNEQYSIDEDGLGRVFNPWYDSRDNSLKAELWIDQKVAENNSRWVDIKAQADGATLEISTGYLLLQIEDKAGSFEGADYNTIQRGIIPLHLAALPDNEGACSNTDGCGINRAKNSETPGLKDTILGILGEVGINLQGSGGAAALNSQNQKEASNMNEALATLVAALMQAGKLTEEQATKLAGNCDCPDLMTQVATNLNSLCESAGKVAVLQTTVTTLKGKLEVYEAKTAENEKKERVGYLKALNMSDEDEATKATPTAFLRKLSINAGHIPEGAVSETEAAKIAELSTKPAEKVPVSLEAADSTPKTEEGK